MFLQWVEADGFLSFGEPARLSLEPGLTVVTGPNGAGKSNIGRCLDVARAVLAPHGSPEAARLELYQDAAFDGTDDFTISLGITLDQPWEKNLVRDYVRACWITSGSPEAQRAEDLKESAGWLVPASVGPLMSGQLVISCTGQAARPWSAAWQFTSADTGTTWHAVLTGDDGINQLRPGTAQHPAKTGGGTAFAGWLIKTKPQDKALLDFQAAMEITDQPVVFSVNAGSGQPDRGFLPEILWSDTGGRTPSFTQVMRLVVERGIALTDNRRLPLIRRFPLPDLAGPADLRDGAAAGAELFRLKNGYPQDRARFREIQETFRQLTGRDLEVRARPDLPDQDEPAMVIEPAVTGQHGETLVELSGAGIQEALVLSTLLHNTPGMITVLDEPAVNLEPAVQRRLIGQVRGPGQYLVITHSADLVPFDEPEDLHRIVRVAPGAAGSVIHRPDYRDQRLKDQLRQLQLIQPAEVRSLLFATAVILCEGQTETGALPRWWQNPRAGARPDPAVTGISFISADGHNGFGRYIRLLDAFAIPWAIIADGPALRKASKLSGEIRDQGHWPPEAAPDDEQDFGRWQRFWEHAGIFTLATQFGDDGAKGGEFEALLEQINPDLLAQAHRETGGSKPRIGSYFATCHPETPTTVLDLQKKITEYLQLP